jgi:hypothetical protein
VTPDEELRAQVEELLDRSDLLRAEAERLASVARELKVKIDGRKREPGPG